MFYYHKIFTEKKWTRIFLSTSRICSRLQMEKDPDYGSTGMYWTLPCPNWAVNGQATKLQRKRETVRERERKSQEIDIRQPMIGWGGKVRPYWLGHYKKNFIFLRLPLASENYSAFLEHNNLTLCARRQIQICILIGQMALLIFLAKWNAKIR